MGGVLYMLTLIGSSPSSQTTEVGSSSEVAELAPLPQKSPLRAQAKAHVSDVAHLDQPAPPLQAQAEDEPLPAPPPQPQPQLPAQAAQTQPATASAAAPVVRDAAARGSCTGAASASASTRTNGAAA